jgi:hypothetical protein
VPLEPPPSDDKPTILKSPVPTVSEVIRKLKEAVFEQQEQLDAANKEICSLQEENHQLCSLLLDSEVKLEILKEESSKEVANGKRREGQLKEKLQTSLSPLLLPPLLLLHFPPSLGLGAWQQLLSKNCNGSNSLLCQPTLLSLMSGRRR